MAEELEKLKNDYDEIIIMTISEKLSGTKNCIKQAADMVGIKNTTIETSSIGHGVGNMIIEAQDMLKKEKTIEEIKEKIEKEHLNYKGYAVVGSIERIKNSGRINSLTALVGSLLNIVPIIEIGNGELKQSGKTRGKEKAVKDIMSRIDKEKVEEVFLMGLEAESQINKLKEEYKEKDIYEEDLILPLARFSLEKDLEQIRILLAKWCLIQE